MSKKTSAKKGHRRYGYTYQLKVAWGDMDALGHVNNVSFNRYFETARAEFFMNLAKTSTYQRPKERGSVISRLEFDYRGQVFYPSELEITVGIVEVASRTFTLACSMWNEKGACVGTGISKHIYIDFTTGRPTRMPDEFIQGLERYLETDTE